MLTVTFVLAPFFLKVCLEILSLKRSIGITDFVIGVDGVIQ